MNSYYPLKAYEADKYTALIGTSDQWKHWLLVTNGKPGTTIKFADKGVVIDGKEYRWFLSLADALNDGPSVILRDGHRTFTAGCGPASSAGSEELIVYTVSDGKKEDTFLAPKGTEPGVLREVAEYILGVDSFRTLTLKGPGKVTVAWSAKQTWTKPARLTRTWRVE